MDDWICSCEACMGTLSPPEPDENELALWLALNEAYQEKYGVSGPYDDKAIIQEGQAADYFFKAGVKAAQRLKKWEEDQEQEKLKHMQLELVNVGP